MRRPLPVNLVLFALLTATLALLVNGYRYGVGDQVEQLPIVRRILDPQWLSADPYVNAQAGFNPRFYFAHLMAALARVAPLWVVALGLQWLCMAGLALATAWFAWTCFGSVLGGSLACAGATMALPFYLGNEGAAWTNTLISSSPALTLAVAGLSLAIQERGRAAALLCGVSAVFHPLVGLETGALVIAATAVRQFVRGRGSAIVLREALLGGAILAPFALLWIVPAMASPGFAEHLDSRAFIDTLAHYRAPHHYLPRQWPREQFLWAAVFSAALGMAWLDWWRRAPVDRAKARVAAALVGGVVSGYLIAVVFVEFIPMRLIVVAQLFRLSFIPGWLGIVLIASVAANRFERQQPAEGVLASLGLGSPAAALVSQGVLTLPRPPLLALTAAIIMAAVALCVGPHRWWATGAMGAAAAGAIVAHLRQSRWLGLAGPVAALAVLVTLLAVDRTHPLAVMEEIRPVWRIEDSMDPFDGLAQFAREHTQSNALFLTPPDWGGFRLAADRAILVDWKTFSFQDRVMAQWRERLEAVHGQPRAWTWAPGELDGRYRAMNDARLRQLAREYGIDYAVLYRETPTQLPVVAEGARYRLVKVGNT